VTQQGLDERDLESTETSGCAVCGHAEDAHEHVELGARPLTICRPCDDAHEFEPEEPGE
jgi:hypothetical protein